MLRRAARAVLAGLLAVALACSDDARAARQTGKAPGATAAARTKRPALPAYRVDTSASGGRLVGRVELEGTPPADTAFQPAATDQAACGTSVVVRRADVASGRVAGVVVSIEGLRAGKPLPLTRRYEVTIDHCRLEPRMLAAVAGGTLNVLNLDAGVHATRISTDEEGEALYTVHQNDAGQVVPVDRVFATAERLVLHCASHPWMRSWVQVFDHPYFTTTARDGAFAMDSVPPGRYAVTAWHPTLGTATDSVTISAGAAAEMVLKFRR